MYKYLQRKTFRWKILPSSSRSNCKASKQRPPVVAFTLKMEAVYSFETLVNFQQTTRSHITQVIVTTVKNCTLTPGSYNVGWSKTSWSKGRQFLLIFVPHRENECFQNHFGVSFSRFGPSCVFSLRTNFLSYYNSLIGFLCAAKHSVLHTQDNTTQKNHWHTSMLKWDSNQRSHYSVGLRQYAVLCSAHENFT